MRKLVLILGLITSLGPRWIMADGLTWVTPIGDFLIPSPNQIQVFDGYGLILKQNVGGVKAPFWQIGHYSDGSKIFNLIDLGAVGVSNSGTYVEPYIGPSLNIPTSLIHIGTFVTNLNVGFGVRWATDTSRHLDVGPNIGFTFGGSTPPPTPTPVPVPVVPPEPVR